MGFASRKKFIDTFLPSGRLVNADGSWHARSMSRNLARLTYEKCFGGDIFDTTWVWFYAERDLEPIDPHRKKDIEEMMRVEGPKALLPSLTDLFPRHRWRGHGEVLREVSVLLTTHGLGVEAIKLWVLSLGAGLTPEREQRAPQQQEPIADGYASEDENVQKESSSSVGVVVASSSLTLDWVEVNKKAKVDVVAWIRKPSTPGTSLILTIVSKPLSSLMDEYLSFSGNAWTSRNDIDSAAGKPRKYRIVEVGKNNMENQFARKALRLLLDPSTWEALPPAHYTLTSRSLAFRALMRAISSVYMLLKLPNEQMPISLFQILDDPLLAPVLVGKPQCMRDEYADEHIKHFCNVGEGVVDEDPAENEDADIDAEGLNSIESLCTLGAVAEIAHPQSTRSETGHAFWQREAKARGMQTVAEAHPYISATWVLHRQRVAERDCRKKEAKSVAPKKKGRPVKTKTATKKKRNQQRPPGRRRRQRKRQSQRAHGASRVIRHGGWGAYRLYIKKVASTRKGMWGGHVFEGIGEMYRQFQHNEPEEFRLMQQQGRAATIARATGATASQAPSAPSALVASSPSASASTLVAVGSPAHVDHPSDLAVALALQAAEALPPTSGKRLLRKVCLGVAATCRSDMQARENDFAAWQASQPSFGLPGDSSIGGPQTGRVVPSPVSRDLYHSGWSWAPPACNLAEHVLSSSEVQVKPQVDTRTARQTMVSMHSELRKAWAARHVAIEHHKLPPLATHNSKLADSKCRRAGVCFCKKEDVLLFRNVFHSLIRRLCKKDKQNPFKLMFETGHAVIQVQWWVAPADLKSDAFVHEDWLYLGYINQHSWAIGLSSLYLDSDVANRRAAQAEGNVALRIAPGGLVELEESADHDIWNIVEMSCFPAALVASFPDYLDHAASFRVFQIVEGSRQLIEMLPAEVEVKATQDEHLLFWPGFTEAKALLAARAKSSRRRAGGLAAAAVPPDDGDIVANALLDDVGDADPAEDEELPWVDMMEAAAAAAAGDSGEEHDEGDLEGEAGGG